MPSLDLKRDAGFLFHGVESNQDKQHMARDLLHIFSKPDINLEWATPEDGAMFLQPQDSGCAATEWNPSAIFKARVAAFFTDVHEVLTLDGDVFYDIADSVQRQFVYDGADLFIDYKTSWQGFAAQFERSAMGMISNPESQDLSWVNTGLWRAMDLPREVVRELQVAGVDKKQVAQEFEYLSFLTQEQRVEAIRGRYVPMTEGLRDEERKSVIQKALDEDFVALRKCDFAIYTQAEHLQELCDDWMLRKAGGSHLVQNLPDRMRDKFVTHREYAEALAKTRPNVSAGLILSIVLIESNGDRTKKNGSFQGLMQLGSDEFAKHVDPALPEDVRTNPFHYQANMSAGANYLQNWCFARFNSGRKLMVAVGNYNWGCGNMRDYTQKGKPLRAETHDYMAKLLVFSRLFLELGVR